MTNCFSNGTFRQYLAGVSSTLSIFVLGTMSAWSSPVIPILESKESQVPMTIEEIAWMVSLLQIANVLSPIPAGYLMDYLGRKNTLLYLTIFPLISWVILLFGTEPYHLYIGRFLGGLFSGVSLTVTPIYVAEISDAKLRGSLCNIASLMMYSGTLFVYVIGPHVGYRTLTYSCLAIPVIFILMFIWMPESPYYFIMKNKNGKALKSLSWLRSGKDKEDIYNELLTIETVTKQQMENSGKFKDLVLTKGNRKAFTIVTVLAMAQRLTGISALVAYSSITIPKQALPGLSVNSCITILGFIWFFAGCISVFLIDSLGRKVLLVISTCGCAITSLTVSTWFFLDQKTNVDVSNLSWIIYAALLIHTIFFSLGIGPIGNTIKSELFPANVKGKASAMTTISLASMAFVVNQSYVIIANSYGMYLNYLVYGISCILTTLFTIGYVIETRGKTLSEIQDELNGSRVKVATIT